MYKVLGVILNEARVAKVSKFYEHLNQPKR